MFGKSRTNLFALVTLLLFTVTLTAVAQQRTPIILDTNIGGDIDDAFAVALVLDSPQLDLRAVTTVSGDTAARARLVAKMLSAAGRPDVPVAAARPDQKSTPPTRSGPTGSRALRSCPNPPSS